MVNVVESMESFTCGNYKIASVINCYQVTKFKYYKIKRMLLISKEVLHIKFLPKFIRDVLITHFSFHLKLLIN